MKNIRRKFQDKNNRIMLVILLFLTKFIHQIDMNNNFLQSSMSNSDNSK
jgi:hypothetical protein